MAFEDVKDAPSAFELIEQWKENAKNKNATSAAIRYMLLVVIPKLHGKEPEQDPPSWVMEELFDEIPPRPQDLESWLEAFPGSAVVVFDDRVRGKPAIKLGRDLYRPEQARDKGLGMFMTVNPVSGKDHKDEDVTKFAFFFMDFDGGDKRGLAEKIGVLPFKPSILIETKNGFHVYYRLKPHNRSEADWRAVEREMIAKEGADPNASNPARVLRMPFAWHCKEEPYLVELRDWNENRYTFEEIEAIYKPQPKKEYKTNKSENYVSLKRAPRGVLLKDQRHNGLMEYLKAAYWRVKDYPEYAGAIRAYTKEWYPAQQNPLKPNWEQEVDKACDWFEKRQWG